MCKRPNADVWPDVINTLIITVIIVHYPTRLQVSRQKEDDPLAGPMWNTMPTTNSFLTALQLVRCMTE